MMPNMSEEPRSGGCGHIRFATSLACILMVTCWILSVYAQPVAGDLDRSGTVNAVDIQLLINRALGIVIDTDGDGLADAAEIKLGLDPLDPDTDDDGISDLQYSVGCTTSGETTPTIVINEVLAHSHQGASDWIELHNVTDRTIDIGGWFLSDSGTNLKKYEIAKSTAIEPDGYIVFFENANFGNEFDPGAHELFALSENGETVYLSSGHDGELTVYRQVEDFGPSATGIAFGRYEKSTGTFNFVAMSENTPGAANSYPLVGPIVINEIMYNPPSGNQMEEYIELHNITDEPVDLHDDAGNSWKFSDGIVLTFPPDTSIPAEGYLIVAKDPAAFRSLYSVPENVDIVGPYEGQMDNGGETLQIVKPGKGDQLADGMYIRVDRVKYDDGGDWPTAADGNGSSLTRVVPSDYGNDVANWTSASPTPGR